MALVKTSLNIERSMKQNYLARGIWNVKLYHWRDVIEDYIIISRRRADNKLSMFKLQFDILQDIYQSQGSIRMLKDVIKTPENIKSYNEDAETLTEDDVNALELQLKQEKVLENAFRDIMDGHLWRLFDYRRPLLYYLGKGKSSGNIELDTGFLREVYNWGDSILSTNVTHFILNDITNFARIGDAIVKYVDNTIEVKEIKSSGSTRGKHRQERLKRQEGKRRILEELANRGTAIIDSTKVDIINVPILYKNSLRQVLKLIRDAEISGIASRKIKSYLHIACIDHEVLEAKKLSKDSLNKLFTSHLIADFEEKDKVIRLESGFRFQFSSDLTPISIYPFPESIIADILLGKKLLFYQFNFSEFERFLKRNNWSLISNVIDLLESGRITENQPFCEIRHIDLTIGIPWSMMSQLIFDTLDVYNIIEFGNYVYRNKIIGSASFALAFKDERKYWN